MTFLRRTSTYLALVETDHPKGVIDDMVRRCPVEVNSSAVYTGLVGIRFRCRSDDNEALNIALQIAAGRKFVLTTGYGINQREVAQ